MTLLKFDNYEIKKDKIRDATSNYDVMIHIYRAGELIKGYSEKSTTDNKVILEQALKVINRDENIDNLTL